MDGGPEGAPTHLFLVAVFGEKNGEGVQTFSTRRCRTFRRMDVCSWFFSHDYKNSHTISWKNCALNHLPSKFPINALLRLPYRCGAVDQRLLVWAHFSVRRRPLPPSR